MHRKITAKFATFVKFTMKNVPLNTKFQKICPVIKFKNREVFSLVNLTVAKFISSRFHVRCLVMDGVSPIPSH